MTRFGRKKKRRMIAAISGVVVLSVVIFAFFIVKNILSNSAGQLSVNYNANENINATITGSYSINNGKKIDLTTQTGEKEIVFNTTEEMKTETKSFKKVTNLKLNKDDELIVEYNIQNNNNYYSMVIDAEVDLVKSSNIIVEYSLDKNMWKTNLFEVFGVSGISIANNDSLNFYVKIFVNQKTYNAVFDGSFNFELKTLGV